MFRGPRLDSAQQRRSSGHAARERGRAMRPASVSGSAQQQRAERARQAGPQRGRGTSASSGSGSSSAAQPAAHSGVFQRITALFSYMKSGHKHV